jgi:hypothetical protein
MKKDLVYPMRLLRVSQVGNPWVIFFYIYKRLRPSEKIRNRKKEWATETLNLKNWTPNLLNLNAGWVTGEGGGRAGLPMQGMGTPT